MGQVTAVNQEQRVYSENGKVFVGMKVKDANTTTEQMKVFNFVDIDKDGQISQKEIERYNSPIFVQRTAKIVGDVSGIVSLHRRGRFSGEHTKYIESEFYTGLTIDKVNIEGRTQFTTMDLNSDGVLSRDEIVKAEKILDKKATLEKDLIDIDIKYREKKHNEADTKIWVGLGSLIGTFVLGSFLTNFCRAGLPPLGRFFSVVGAIVLPLIMSGFALYDILKENPEAEKEKTEKKEQALNEMSKGCTSDEAKEKIKLQFRTNNLHRIGKP